MNKLTNQSNSTQDTEDVVARVNRRIDLLEQGDPRAATWVADFREILAERQSLSDRIDVLEDKLGDAYKRGWREGCETLLDDYEISGLPETPHPDAMGEGCGNFMAEYYAALHQEGIATDVGR